MLAAATGSVRTEESHPTTLEIEGQDKNLPKLRFVSVGRPFVSISQLKKYTFPKCQEIRIRLQIILTLSV